MNTLMTKTMEEWVTEGKKNQKEYVFFNGYCLDLTSFKKIHPGGSQVITTYRFKDVTNILFSVFPHNQHTTPKILQKYRIGLLKQTPAQTTKIQGTILKQRNNQRDFSVKKQVKFSSDVKNEAQQKEKAVEMSKSRAKSTKSSNKNLHATSMTTLEEKKSKRAKNINQDYLDALKGSSKSLKSIQKLTTSENKIKQDPKVAKFDSEQMKTEKTMNVSIKKHLKNSEAPTMDFFDQSIPQIRVPILNVRLDRIW